MRVQGLHHVQVAMPRDGEERARSFYGGLLGLAEVAKPPNLLARGGLWFEIGAQQLHLGVEPEFRPASKAHPALLVEDLEGLRAKLVAGKVPIREDEPLVGFRRFYALDPFGNRLEFLEPQDG